MDKYLKIFKALGDKTRFRIVKMLALKDYMCVCEIRTVIDFSMPTISNHLKILSEAGLVTSFKKDKYVNYKLNNNISDDIFKKVYDMLDNITDNDTLTEDKNRTLKANRLELC